MLELYIQSNNNIIIENDETQLTTILYLIVNPKV